VTGLDISDYAITNCHPDSAGKLIKGSCESLPFKDASFDLTLSINTIHNLPPEGCEAALREMERVAPGHGFAQVDAYRSLAEKEIFEDWMLTARTCLMPEEWLHMFEHSGYRGDYYWTILEADGGTA
jgi:ubiquinone/menaquinone biosynthesis C-methylase UbiE